MTQISEHTQFSDNGRPIGLSMLDFWKYQYSNIYDLQDQIAEFLVGKALGINEAHNRDGWTLFDIKYRDTKVEVKETGYYHSWQEKYADGKISERRSFGIQPAYTEYKVSSTKYERQNEIYIFCLNTGTTPEDSNPLDVTNWEFYVVPTSVINANCTNVQKTITLSKVQKLAKKVSFHGIRSEVDTICDKLGKLK